MKDTRETALLALYDIEFEGKYSNLAVKEALIPNIKTEDKALITNIVYGVVRRKLTLDYIISKYSSVKLKKLSKFVLLILRMGVYQIYFMDKIPQSAAVNESVKLAKKYCARSAGFVNAILHAVIRGMDIMEYPKDRTELLSVKYSFTEEMVRLFMKTDFCEELLESLNEEPKTTVRVNTLKCSDLKIAGAKIEKSPLYPQARYISGFDIAASEEYKKGHFIAQDVAAMMAAEALSPKPGELCIDVCAAPGGKTTHLAELMKNEGRIIAFDIHPHKVEIIRKNASRMGADIIEAYCRDALCPDEALLGQADKVLADVPCSGLGIIRKKPDIKWHKENIGELNLLQYEILEAASKYLKVGGELVYSTCTLDRRENEDVITEFVKQNREFEFCKVDLPGPLSRQNSGYITLYPNIDNTDGFFIAKIKRCK